MQVVDDDLIVRARQIIHQMNRRLTHRTPCGEDFNLPLGHGDHLLPGRVHLPASWNVKYHALMRIGELAARSEVSTKTIRYYEEAGLLPHPARTGGGYRDYDEPAVQRLAFVRAGQSIGLTLGEIREVLAFRDRGDAPCEHVASLIQQHADDLAERIAAMVSMQRELLRLARRARRRAAPTVDGPCYCHIIEGARPRSAGSVP
jgi:DNA-binding transcriptional MerR regulator